jgi:Txe/YoeB family toxin of Txe-Axe toxin-antitoxin module
LSIIVEPRLGIGKPERLKYVLSKFEIYSRRINEKDRLIYLIDEGK